MTAVSLDPTVTPVGKGWRVARADGTVRMVLPRPQEGWAVFSGPSTDKAREPRLGYSGSWHRELVAAVEWARTHGLGS